MIVAAMPFLNELDLLEIKCRELAGVVDLFVIVESPLTFTGLPKPLVFAENKARFAQWPMHHVVVNHTRDYDSAWDREYAQRMEIYRAIAKLRPEIAIYCDTDECPRRESVEHYAAKCHAAHTMEMAQLLFFFDRFEPSVKWSNVKIWRFKKGEDMPWRGTYCPSLTDAGWHFEYFGKRETLLEKLAAFSHAGEPGCEDFRAKVVTGKLPGIERTVPYPAELLPRYVRENRERFAGQFAP